MHLIERYSLNTGVKIHKPYIYEQFFPVKDEKYIVFHPVDEKGKNYKYWQEVLNVLVPILEQNNIKVYQLGQQPEKNKNSSYAGVYNLINQTSRPNVAYLVKNSLLYLGSDTFSSQFAGYYDKKRVVIYSHVLKEHRRPYWGSKDNEILIEPNSRGRKPHYHKPDVKNDASQICPYSIVSAACKLLNLNYKNDYKTVYAGEAFQKRILDFVPNVNIAKYNLTVPLVRCRMDLEFNQQVLFDSLNNFKGKMSIVTNKPIDLAGIHHHQKKIEEIFYILEKDKIDLIDENFIKRITSLSAVHFASFEDEDSRGLFKLKFMDCMFINAQETPSKDSVLPKEDLDKELFYKPAKLILSNGQVYPNLYDYNQNKPIDAIKDVILPIQDHADFWKESPFYSILEKID